MRSRLVALFVITLLLLAPTIARAETHVDPDNRARVSFVEGILDEDGQLWFKVGFYAPWDDEPPSDLFSLFWSLVFQVGDATAQVGWEVHDGEMQYLGDPGTQAFILDNGCVVVGTGLFPTGDFTVSVQAEFASWQDEATTEPVSGSGSMGTSAEFIDRGDPFTAFGGSPVYDLANGEIVTANGEIDTTTTTTQATSQTTAGTPADDDTTSSVLDDGGGLSPMWWILILILILGLLYWLLVYVLRWWRPPWLGKDRYAYRVGGAMFEDIVEDEPDQVAGIPPPAGTDAPVDTDEAGGFVYPGVFTPVDADDEAGGFVDCAELLRRWKAAEARAERLRAELEEAGTALESRRAESDRLEAEVARLQGAKGGSSATMDGVTHFRIDGELVSEPDLDHQIETTRTHLDTSRARETHLAEMMRQVEGAAATADADAAKTRAAYEECIGAAAGGAATPLGDDGTDDSPHPSPPGTAAATGGGGEQTQVSRCSDPDAPDGAMDLRPGDPVSIKVYVDSTVFTEVDPASERPVDEGRELASDLGQLAGDFSLAGSALGGGSALNSISGGVRGLRQGSYVRGAAGMAEGTAAGVAATGNLGTDSFPIPIPTSLPEVVVGTAQLTAQLGALVAGKVSDWNAENQRYLLQHTMFYRQVTLRPVEVWQCRGGSWQCLERLLEYEVGSLKRERQQSGEDHSFTVKGDLQRDRFEAEVTRLGEIGARRVAESAQSLAEAEERLAPGPCG